MSRLTHKIAYRLIAMFHGRWLYNVGRYITYHYVNIQKGKDWGGATKPFYFKKETDLYSWYFQAERTGAQWLQPGAHARQYMFPNCKILDLCSGDGFFPYMFYAECAISIDAVDFDKSAIKHAEQNYSARNINYYKTDIVKQELPGNSYDFVVWNTAMDYFTREQLDLIFEKIKKVSRSDMMFIGSVPKVHPDEKHSDNHVKHFSEIAELEAVLGKHFKDVNVFYTDYRHRSTFYYTCKQPITN